MTQASLELSMWLAFVITQLLFPKFWGYRPELPCLKKKISGGNQTLGLVYDRQAPYQLNHPSSPRLSFKCTYLFLLGLTYYEVIVHLSALVMFLSLYRKPGYGMLR